MLSTPLSDSVTYSHSKEGQQEMSSSTNLAGFRLALPLPQPAGAGTQAPSATLATSVSQHNANSNANANAISERRTSVAHQPRALPPPLSPYATQPNLCGANTPAYSSALLSLHMQDAGPGNYRSQQVSGIKTSSSANGISCNKSCDSSPGLSPRSPSDPFASLSHTAVLNMHKAPSSRIVQEPFDATAPRPSMAFPSSSVRTGSVHSGSDFSDMQSCFISNGGDPMVGGGFASRGIAIPQNTGNGQRAEQAWSYESNGSLSFDLGGMGLNSLPPNQIAHQQQQIGTERTQASHFFDDCLNSFQLPLARCLNLPPYKSQAEEFQANKQPPMFTSQSSLSIVIPSTSSSTTFNDSNVSIDSFNVPSYNKGQDTNNNSMFSQSLPNWSLQDNTTNLNEFFLGTESPFTNHVNRSNSIPAWVFTSSSSLPDVNHMGILGIPCTPSPVGNGHMPERIIHRSNSMDSYTSPLGFTVTSPSSSPVQFGHQVPQVQSPQSHQFQQSILGFPNTPQSSSPPCMNSTEYQHSSLHPNPNATFSNQHFQPTAINATKASSAPSRKRRMTAHLRSGVPPMFGAMMRTHSAPNNDASFQNSISIPSTSNMMWYPASSEKCVKPISTGSEGPDAATPILPPKLQQRRSSSTAALNRLEKPFICEEVECGKRFTRTHDLERHRRSSHLNAKDFRCTHCDASFSRKDASYRHMRLKKCNATGSLDFPEPIV